MAVRAFESYSNVRFEVYVKGAVRASDFGNESGDFSRLRDYVM